MAAPIAACLHAIQYNNVLFTRGLRPANSQSDKSCARVMLMCEVNSVFELFDGIQSWLILLCGYDTIANMIWWTLTTNTPMPPIFVSYQEAEDLLLGYKNLEEGG